MIHINNLKSGLLCLVLFDLSDQCAFLFSSPHFFFGDDFEQFFPEEYRSYAKDIVNNRFILLVIGIVLSIVGGITKVKQRLNRNAVNQDGSLISDGDSGIVKKDYIAEQDQHKVQQLIDKQEGHLKELALKVEWKPLSGGGANFKTSSLKRINASRLEASHSKGGLIFGGIFLIVGLAIMSIGGNSIYKDDGLDWDILFPIIFGAIFASAGAAMIYWPRPRIFDLRQGWFWAGNKSLVREQDFMQLKHSARLSEIAVIQIIPERVSSRENGSYSSWEINLVSKDGQRLNVMDHGHRESIVTDAQLLGEFLGVPVWENI